MMRLVFAALLVQSVSAQMQTIPAVGAAAHPPTITRTGLIAQYDFVQGANAAVLYDSSGLANDGTVVGSPSYVSGGGIAFAANTQWATFPSAVASAWVTVQIVATQTGTGTRTVISHSGSTSPGLFFQSASGERFLVWNGSSNLTQTDVAAYDDTHSGYRLGLSQLWTWVSGSSADKLYQGGIAMTQNLTSGSSGFARGTTGYIGSYRGTTTTPIANTVYYALFYNRELSAAEIAENERALRWILWSRAGNAKALIYFHGDSLTMGANSSGPSAHFSAVALAALPGGSSAYDSVERGLSGNTTTQLSTDAVGQVDIPQSKLTRRKNLLVLQEGINDILGGADAATAYARYVSYCTRRRRAGMNYIVLVTVPANNYLGNGATFETTRAAFNALLRANWRTFAEGLVDLDTVPELSTVAGASNTTYYSSDKLHLTDAGYALMGQAVAQTLVNLVP